jgi:chemotaxis protein histidine kinase CheA
MIYLLVTATALALVGLGFWLARRDARPAQSSSRRGNLDEIDDELRGVFIAEVKSEIGNLRRNLMLWKAAPANLGRLMPLRRSFHSLKGSSRMVGATTLGDFNARFERLLDRVIDKSLLPEQPIVSVVEQAVAALPELLAQFEGTRAPRADIAAIMKTADRLTKAERAVVRPLRAAGASSGADSSTDPLNSLPLAAAAGLAGMPDKGHARTTVPGQTGYAAPGSDTADDDGRH